MVNYMHADEIKHTADRPVVPAGLPGRIPGASEHPIISRSTGKRCGFDANSYPDRKHPPPGSPWGYDGPVNRCRWLDPDRGGRSLMAQPQPLIG